MSSWYVWAALGLYPVTSGTPILTVTTPLFDRAEIRLPAGKSITISAPGASSGLKYIGGLAIDGQPTDQTYLPDSIIRAGGDVSFSLSAVPNPFWGVAAFSAPPAFGAGSSTVTVNASPRIVSIAPGATAIVTVDVQRMIDGPGDYTITGTSSQEGIAPTPVSGQFAADGSSSGTLAITVAQSVPDGYYPVVLTTTVGESARESVVVVAVAQSTA
jgi:hypothetical protein